MISINKKHTNLLIFKNLTTNFLIVFLSDTFCNSSALFTTINLQHCVEFEIFPNCNSSRTDKVVILMCKHFHAPVWRVRVKNMTSTSIVQNTWLNFFKCFKSQLWRKISVWNVVTRNKKLSNCVVRRSNLLVHMYWNITADQICPDTPSVFFSRLVIEIFGRHQRRYVRFH